MRCAWLIFFLVVGERASVALRLDSSQATSKCHLWSSSQLQDREDRFASRLARRGSESKRQSLSTYKGRANPSSPALSSQSLSLPLDPLPPDSGPPSPSRTKPSLHSSLSPLELSPSGLSAVKPTISPSVLGIVQRQRPSQKGVSGLTGQFEKWMRYGRKRLVPSRVQSMFAKNNPGTSSSSIVGLAGIHEQLRKHVLPSYKEETRTQELRTSSIASTSKTPKSSANLPSTSRLDYDPFEKRVGQAPLYRANSDPLMQRYPPIRKSRAIASKISKPVSGRSAIRPGRSSPGVSEISHSSFDVAPPITPRVAGSSARSSIATSAFADMSEGPAITGAGLRTTIDDWPSSVLPSLSCSRQTSAGSMSSYEMPSHCQPQVYNGGTATGPQSLAGLARDKISIAKKYSKDHPGEVLRASGSTIGHAFMGFGPAAAVGGSLGLASSIGVTGALLTYINGNERIIPKINQWQQGSDGKESK